MSRIFAGSTDYIHAADNAAYHFTGDYTFAFWLKLTAPQSEYKPLFWKGKLDGSDADILLAVTQTGHFYWNAYEPATTNVPFFTTAGLVSDSNWHHIALVRSGTTVSIFIDGVADANTGTFTGANYVGGAAYLPIIGGLFTGMNVAALNGLVSQAELFNVALTSTQLSSISRSPGAVATGLIGNWVLDSATASPEPDDSSLANVMIVGTGTTHSADEPAVAPAPPTLLVGTAGDARVDLSWTLSVTVSPAITFQHVYRGTAALGPFTILPAGGSVSASATTFADTTALNGSTYYYVVRAFDGTSESGNSNATATMQPVSVGAAPAAPTTVVATAGNNSVGLTWVVGVPATGILSQRVYRSTTAGSGYVVLAVGSALSNSATSFTDSTATNGTTYYYVIRSWNGSLESANSNQVTGTPVSGVTPLPPSNFVATPGDNLVSFFWTRSTVPGVIEQRIYRTVIQGDYTAPTARILTINDNVRTISTDLTAVNGTSYYYVLRTWNGVSESVNGSEQGPIIPSVDAPPLPPTNLTGVSGNHSIFLTWTPSTTPGVTQQLVYRSLASGVYGAALATIADNVTSTYTDSTAVNDVPFFYTVRASY